MLQRAQIVHHIPGRLRIKLPSAKGKAAMLEHIKRALSPQHGVRRVDVNPMTGSVLVHYEPDFHNEYLLRLAAHAENAKLFTLEPPELTETDEFVHKVKVEAEFLASRSEAARTIVDFFKRLNESVKVATGNAVDLNVLLPLSVAIFSFFEVGVEAATPLWVTLCIFSFNSFVTLHYPTSSSADGDS